MPHAILHAWLIYGPGETNDQTIDRIKEHDAIAKMHGAELMAILRSPIWAQRILEIFAPRPDHG